MILSTWHYYINSNNDSWCYCCCHHDPIIMCEYLQCNITACLVSVIGHCGSFDTFQVCSGSPQTSPGPDPVFTPPVIKIMSWLELYLRKEASMWVIIVSFALFYSSQLREVLIWVFVVFRTGVNSWNIRGGAQLSKGPAFCGLIKFVGNRDAEGFVLFLPPAQIWISRCRGQRDRGSRRPNLEWRW